MANATIVAVAVAYFAVLVGIGIWATRRTKTHADFFIAGKGVGLFAIALATMSSAISGFLFIGGPGFVYQFGFGALLLTFPASVSFALAWYLLAKRMRLLGHGREILTIPDALVARFGGESTRALSAVAILVGMTGYLAVQVLAMGFILAFVFDIGLAAAVVVGVAIVVSYAVAGGMVAGVYTDVVQGGIMVVASVVIFALALQTGGGLGNMVTTIAAEAADYVGPWGLLPAAVPIAFYLVFSVGILGQPHVAHKFLMIKDPRLLKWGAVVAAVTAMVASLVMFSVGTVVRHLDVTGQLAVGIADEAAPLFMLNYTPDLLAGVFFAGVASASMSTADSFLNIGSAALVRDLPKAAGRPLSDRAQLVWGRIATVVLGVLAGAVAIFSGELVAVLGIFGWGTFAAAIAPALGLGLNWKRATREGALASIAAGTLVQAFLGLNMNQGWFPGLLPGHVAEVAVSFLVGFLVFIVVSFATSPRPLEEDVALVMEL